MPYLVVQPTLQGPTVTAAEALNTTCMTVSWNDIGTAGEHTYAVVLYSVEYIRSVNAGSSTSLTICDLEHLDTFTVFVVAISGDSYGASSGIFTLEACKYTYKIYL